MIDSKGNKQIEIWNEIIFHRNINNIKYKFAHCNRLKSGKFTCKAAPHITYIKNEQKQKKTLQIQRLVDKVDRLDVAQPT